ncbi:MAG: hypothetical protein WAP23_02220 [Candidatus Spechtbacterales bacterium]
MERLVVEGVNLTEFLGIPYVASRHPGNILVDDFLANPGLGANCQLFALGVLRKAGFYVDEKLPMDQGGRFGSRELWLDCEYTEVVKEGTCSPEVLMGLFFDDKLQPFDIYFFLPPGTHPFDAGLLGRRELLKKLHIAVWMGFVETGKGGYASPWLHNAKPNPSVLWSRKDFDDAGYFLFGVKRPIRRVSS